MSGKLSISQSVRIFVNSLKAKGGSKDFIDTQDEYNELSNYLNGSEKEKFSADDKLYIKGLMVEAVSRSNAGNYAQSALKAVNRWSDDTNKAEFDALFGTADKAGNVNAYNIVEVLSEFKSLTTFVKGIEEQDSDDLVSSFNRITFLINERLNLMVNNGILSKESSRYLNAKEAVEKIDEIVGNKSSLSGSELDSIAQMLYVIVRDLNGTSVYDSSAFVSVAGNGLYMKDAGMPELASKIMKKINSSDDDANKEQFDYYFGDGTLENPGAVSATNIIEVLDNIGPEMEEFVEDIYDMNNGDNIASIKRLATLLQDRLELVLELGVINKNHSIYKNAEASIEQINDYVKSGFEDNIANIATEIINVVNALRGINGASNIWRSVPADELAGKALQATASWSDDTNKERFDYLFGTGSVQDRTPINCVNIVDVLDAMSGNQLDTFINGIEDQDDGNNTASMQRILDLLEEHLRLLIKSGKVKEGGSFEEKIKDKFEDIQIYMNNGFYDNEKRITNILRSIISQLKVVKNEES